MKNLKKLIPWAIILFISSITFAYMSAGECLLLELVMDNLVQEGHYTEVEALAYIWEHNCLEIE